MSEEHKNETLTDEERRRLLREKRWKRRRNWDRTRISLFTVMGLGVMMVLITLFLLVFPRSTVSEIEKRDLEGLPEFTFASYFSGDFNKKLAIHYDDTVPYRDFFKNAGNNFKHLFGFRSAENTMTFINKPLIDVEGAGPAETETPEASKPAETPAATSEPAEPAEPEVPEEPEPQKDFRAEEADFNLSNGLLVVYQDDHWKCLGLFGGGSGSTYAEALNTLQEKVGKNVKIYSMPAPLASQFYLPKNASDYSSDQKECFDSVAEKLNDGIISINVCDELAKHTEEDIYCRTDHHWQALGAYYACKVFAETAGVPYPELDKYEKQVREGYVGTMYAFSEDSRILNDPEDFTWYVPTCNYTAYFYDTSFNYKFEDDLLFETDTPNSYLTFIGSDEYVVKAKTSVKNHRKLLVIKDSYGNAEIPFFTGSFEEVYVADMRYFQRNLPNFIKSMGITDVLFSMCSYSVVGGNADNLMNLVTQDPDSTIVDEQIEIAKQEAEAARQAELEQPDPETVTEETSAE